MVRVDFAGGRAGAFFELDVLFFALGPAPQQPLAGPAAACPGAVGSRDSAVLLGLHPVGALCRGAHRAAGLRGFAAAVSLRTQPHAAHVSLAFPLLIAAAARCCARRVSGTLLCPVGGVEAAYRGRIVSPAAPGGWGGRARLLVVCHLRPVLPRVLPRAGELLAALPGPTAPAATAIPAAGRAIGPGRRLAQAPGAGIWVAAQF